MKTVDIPFRYITDFSTANITKLDTELSELNSMKAVVSIVDKRMGPSDPPGTEFITRDLAPMCKQNDLLLISCVFTSNPQNNNPIGKTDNFGVYEIEKGNAPIPDIYSVLLFIAYTFLMKQIKDSFELANSETFALAQKNPLNLCELLKKSASEDIAPFQVILNWYSLAFEHSKELDLLKKINHWGLNSLISTEIRFDKQAFANISQELLELNQFEHFDFNVNEKYSPITSGDVFVENGQYFVLLGQSCDISLRPSDNARKDKVASLFKAEVASSDQNLEKISVASSKGQINITINYFGKGKHLKINPKKSKSFDFKVLDLCTLSASGSASLPLNFSLDPEVKKILPLKREDYFQTIHNEITPFISLEPEILNHINTTSAVDTPLSSFTIQDKEGNIKWPIKRVCRIKDPLQQALLGEVANIKGRVGFNTIAPTNITATPVKFSCSYFGESPTNFDFLHLNEPITVEELKPHIKQEHYDSLKSYGVNELTLGTEGKGFRLKKTDNKFKLEISFRLKTEYINKQQYSVSKLFNASLPSEARGQMEISYVDSNEKTTLNKVDILQDISRGISYNGLTATRINGEIVVK